MVGGWEFKPSGWSVNLTYYAFVVGLSCGLCLCAAGYRGGSDRGSELILSLSRITCTNGVGVFAIVDFLQLFGQCCKFWQFGLRPSYPLLGVVTIFMVLGVTSGGWLASYFSAATIKLSFALVITLVAVNIFFSRPGAWQTSKVHPLKGSLCGLVAGWVSGITGLGEGWC